MMYSRAIEWAVAALLRRDGALGEAVIRPWRSVGADGWWDKGRDRDYPVVDVRAGGISEEMPSRTMTVDVSVAVATKTQDDRDHAVVAGLFGEVERVLLGLYDEAHGGAGGDVLDYFEDSVAEVAGEGAVLLGGMTLGDGDLPADEDGLSVMRMVLRVHFARGPGTTEEE